MPILKQNESSYKNIEPGTHPARCYGMISLGTQPSGVEKYSPSFQALLLFEFPSEIIEVNGEKKPMSTNHYIKAYLGSVRKPSKTNLFLTSWRGRAFTDVELAGFDLAKVVGATCLLNIVHSNRNGKTREDIASISPLPKGMTLPIQFNQSIVYEIEEGRNEKFRALPEWIQKKIELCSEWTKPLTKEELQHTHTKADEKFDDVPF